MRFEPTTFTLAKHRRRVLTLLLTNGYNAYNNTGAQLGAEGGTMIGKKCHHLARAEWIAAGAVYLASDEACYMTGQDLTIDGGYVMDGSLPGAKYWEK